MTQPNPTTHVAITIEAFQQIERIAMEAPTKFGMPILTALSVNSPLSFKPAEGGQDAAAGPYLQAVPDVTADQAA
jgi:hypothetical protein